MATDSRSQLDRQLELVGTTQTGVIILGDISGYSRLLSSTELEHARGIILHLFDKIYAATQPQFIVNEIEGDAVFAYGVAGEAAGKLVWDAVEQLKAYGHAFYHAKEDLVQGKTEKGATACTCAACMDIGDLEMKFIVHYGDFAFNQVGPFVKLVGGSVIVAHRLLKNAVPGKSYVLMSQETLAMAPEPLRESFVPLTERIEYFGEVPVGYRLFDWEKEDAKHHRKNEEVRSKK